MESFVIGFLAGIGFGYGHYIFGVLLLILGYIISSK
jgi:hypothetical protein